MTAFRTMIVPAADADLARSIADTISPENYSGMFTTPCCDVDDPTVITHYISTGIVTDEFAHLVPLATWTQEDGNWVQTDYYPGDPVTVAEACAAADPPLSVTSQQVEDIFHASDVTEQDPFVAMQRLGLTLYQEPINA